MTVLFMFCMLFFKLLIVIAIAMAIYAVVKTIIAVAQPIKETQEDW